MPPGRFKSLVTPALYLNNADEFGASGLHFVKLVPNPASTGKALIGEPVATNTYQRIPTTDRHDLKARDNYICSIFRVGRSPSQRHIFATNDKTCFRFSVKSEFEVLVLPDIDDHCNQRRAEVFSNTHDPISFG
jgi:hypothetical protein